MRTIKFRAWDTREEKMAMVGTICPGVGATEDDKWGDRGHYFPDCRLVLMQFTGLKDKNGKEIYEKDLVKDWQGVVKQIKFSRGKFINYKEGEIDDDISTDCEVIGNVYENDIIKLNKEEK